MAKITLDLNRFKASGVYTIEFDASERIVVTTQTIRLVVGFSRKGPINAPVFLRDGATARKVYGPIDAFLEKRGSFFHRALEICLQTAPVFGLNLLPLNDLPVNQGGDAVDYRSFAVSASEENGPTMRGLFSSFYNKERFWFPDTSYLQATVDSKPLNAGRLFNFVNLGQEVQSIIIRKSDNASQYNVTADEYYGRGEVPAYIYPNDYLSDYFVDIYVVKGDWTNLPLLSVDPVYSKYFDLRGVKADKFFEFLSLDDITVTGSFTGTIIPDFVDNNGSNQSIDTILNSAVALTGIFCNINKEVLDDYANSLYKVDMVGNSLITTDDDVIDFLSYNTPIRALLKYEGPDETYNGGFEEATQPVNSAVSPIPYIKSYPFGGTKGKFNNVLVIPKPYPVDTTFTVAQYEALAASLNTNSLIYTHGTDSIINSMKPNDFVKVDNIIDTGASIELHLSSPAHADADYENGGQGAESNYIQTSTAASIPVSANTITIVSPTAMQPLLANGNILLIEAPGYAKYFEILSATSGTTSTVTVKTSLTVGGPWFRDKYCVAGFPADEFSSFLQPSDIKVSVFQVSDPAALDLVPDLDVTGTPAAPQSIKYILNPAAMYQKIAGIGQVLTGAPENKVSVEWLDVSDPLADWAPITGNWHMFNNGTAKAYNIDSASADFRKVVVRSATGVNPFDPVIVLNLAVGDRCRITLPSGQQFYGDISVTTTNVANNVYNVIAPGTGPNPLDPGEVLDSVATLAQYEIYPANKLARNIVGAIIVDGDGIKYGTGNSEYNFVNVDGAWNRSKDPYTSIAYGLTGAKLEQFKEFALSNRADSTWAALNDTYIANVIYDDAVNNTYAVALFSSLGRNLSEPVDIEAPGLYGGGKKFKLTSANESLVQVGDYVVNNDTENPILVRIINKAKKLDPVTGLPFYEYTTLETPKVDTTSGVSRITRYKPIQKFCDRYQFTRLSGFRLTDFHLPGSPAQLQKIYGVLENTNLAITLADKDLISFRYIVDTFNGGLEPNMGPKQILSRLARNRQKCLAFINAPSIKQFIDSTDPRFTELPDPAAGNPKPVLNTDYIATGGNLTLGPSYVWGLPDEEQGAKFMGVFSPNIIIRENNKEVSIPPAADVSNNFIRKFLNGEPYSIVAGPRRGVISNPNFVRLEYDYLLRDRENLEPIGINPIVSVRNVGPMIFANQTAFQRTVSAFNNLHVRDLLITITEAIEEILQNFLFEFNDASTRLEIRTIVENYLDTVRTAGGVFDYSVIMDETNNTPAIIDQNFGIIDVGIEPARGMQKFINRITVLKTGAISSGGFTAA